MKIRHVLGDPVVYSQLFAGYTKPDYPFTEVHPILNVSLVNRHGQDELVGFMNYGDKILPVDEVEGLKFARYIRIAAGTDLEFEQQLRNAYLELQQLGRDAAQEGTFYAEHDFGATGSGAGDDDRPDGADSGRDPGDGV